MISTLIKATAISTLALIACSRAPRPDDAPKSIPSAAPAPSTPPDSTDGGDLYTGTIGNNIPIRMRLRRQGAKLGGTYQYVKVGKDLELSGTVSPDGRIEMDEYHGGEMSTGKFVGSFVGNTLIEGVWIEGVRGEPKQLPFTLRLNKPAGVADFTGSWTYENDGYVFSLDLGVRGDSVFGYHCAVTKNATRVDCNDLHDDPSRSEEPPTPSILGTIRGNIATVIFHSAYGVDSLGEPVSGQATITLNGDAIDWKITGNADGDYYLAREAVLKRAGR
ncbi:MAG: hypothetical protein JWQ98_1779 [Chlorobi bacterium]|nr:hypothetical protein [Chlorobiota bacterium]